jgi:hypothetical protein
MKRHSLFGAEGTHSKTTLSAICSLSASDLSRGNALLFDSTCHCWNKRPCACSWQSFPHWPGDQMCDTVPCFRMRQKQAQSQTTSKKQAASDQRSRNEIPWELPSMQVSAYAMCLLALTAILPWLRYFHACTKLAGALMDRSRAGGEELAQQSYFAPGRVERKASRAIGC